LIRLFEMFFFGISMFGRSKEFFKLGFVVA